VARLLAESGVKGSEVKGTGVRGMLTKGDVLAHLGKAKSPTGTFKEAHGGVAALGGAPVGGAKVSSPASTASSRAASEGKKKGQELTLILFLSPSPSEAD
jgi:pyruvate/2-oxoglutarate dehydrogenase complex dihydrolipoamide acyltransferase (E2) component